MPNIIGAKAALFLALFGFACIQPNTAKAGPTSSEIEFSEQTAIDERGIIPGHFGHEWRKFIQLMWIADEDRLDRIAFYVKDPLFRQDLEISWQPETVFDPEAQAKGNWGRGRLVWRKNGSRPYDNRAVQAVYDGPVRDGLFEGHGRYWHRSGLLYEGGWSLGLMHGSGVINWPGGDSFTGEFSKGQPDGHGRLTSRFGGVFVGSYRDGRRHGHGRVTLPDGRSYHSFWQVGIEDLHQRNWSFPNADLTPKLSQNSGQSDLRFGVSVDRRVPTELMPELYVGYDSRTDGNTLTAYPGDQGFMDRWRGRELLISEHVDLYDTPEMHHPANFVMSLENAGVRPIQIIAGYLSVESSTPELDPMINLRTPIDCGQRTDGSVFLRNWGWSEPIGARVEGGLVTTDGGRFLASINSSTIQGWPDAKLDLGPVFPQIGPEIAAMSGADLVCATSDYAGCLRTAQAQGLLGTLTDGIYLKRNALMIDYFGTLKYQWQDANGTTNEKASPVRFPLKIGQFQSAAECGEGSDAPQAFPNAFQLDTNRQSYQVPFPFNATLAQGQLSSWTFQIDAQAASRHRFQMVLQLSDGRQVASQLVDLTYFKPRDIYRIR